MADYSVRFHEKFILKLNVKLKKQNVVCAHEFLYGVLGISALLQNEENVHTFIL